MLHVYDIMHQQAQHDDASNLEEVMECVMIGAPVPSDLLHWLIAVPLQDTPILDNETWDALTSYGLSNMEESNEQAK